MAVSSRLFKQAVYAGGFIFFVLLVLSSLTISLIQARPSAQPSPTPTTIFQPIVMEKVDFVSHEHSVDAVARLRNPNPRAGIAELPVKFTFKTNQGEVVADKTVVTYILPGSLQYAVALQVPTTKPISQINVELPANPTFQALPNDVDLPVFGSFPKEQTAITVGGVPYEQEKGIVTNNSTFDYARVEVVIMSLNDQGQVVGIGQTFAGLLKVGERREFTVSWPQPTSLSQRIIIVPSTNSFRSDNIVQVIGDPSTLR